MLNDVIEILQLEESTSRTLETLDPEQKNLHYARYDERRVNPKNDRYKWKKDDSSSTNSNSRESTSLCYRCCKAFIKGPWRIAKQYMQNAIAADWKVTLKMLQKSRKISKEWKF